MAKNTVLYRQTGLLCLSYTWMTPHKECVFLVLFYVGIFVHNRLPLCGILSFGYVNYKLSLEPPSTSEGVING